MKKTALKIFGRKTFLLPAAFSLCLLGAAGCFGSEGGQAADHAHTVAQMKDFGWRILNFAIVVAILVWAAKKVDIKGLLAARREGVEKALRDAEEARDAAEMKYMEYSEKLEKASREIDEIYAAIKQETEAEKARMLAEANATAERIREQAAATSRQEIQKARTQLREEAARLSVQLASQALKEHMGKNDQDRYINEFIDEYLTKVEKSH
jgi:F-type H+-transporting ATPase subunit b